MSGSQEIAFGQNSNQEYHAFRYTDALGLNRNEVIETIRGDLQPLLPLPAPAPRNTPVKRRVIVHGVELVYRAFAVSEELVNVGSIAGP